MNAQREPDLSVVIVAWSCREDLLACLRSLAVDQGCLLQTIVVDNASADGTAEEVRQGFPEVQLVASSTNLGFARGCNVGARLAAAPWLLLLNPDTVVPPGTLGRWLGAARSTSGLGASGPKLLNVDGTVQPSVRRLPSPGSVAALLLKLHRLLPSTLRRTMYREFNYDQPAVVPQVMGAALLTPTDVYRRLGGLDERYHVWYEDVDYCAKVAAAGLQVYYEPSVSITHSGGASFGQRRTLWQQRQLVRSALAYARQHFGLGAALVYAVAPVSVALGAVSSMLPPALLRRARRGWYH